MEEIWHLLDTAWFHANFPPKMQTSSHKCVTIVTPITSRMGFCRSKGFAKCIFSRKIMAKKNVELFNFRDWCKKGDLWNQSTRKGAASLLHLTFQQLWIFFHRNVGRFTKFLLIHTICLISNHLRIGTVGISKNQPVQLLLGGWLTFSENSIINQYLQVCKHFCQKTKYLASKNLHKISHFGQRFQFMCTIKVWSQNYVSERL